MDPVDAAAFRTGLRRIGPRQGPLDALIRLAVRAGFRLVGWRVFAAGLDRLPIDGRGRPGGRCLIVAAPHRAWIDPFLLLAVWPRHAARLAWFGDGATMVRSWWRRLLFPRLGMIPITSGTGGPRSYAEMAAIVLDAGCALVVFPEKGPPSSPDTTRTIAPGFAYLALRSGAPVIPVVLGGTHRIVRGSPFTVDLLERLDPGSAVDDPFTPEGRARADDLVGRYAALVAAILPARTARADRDRPARDRWQWLATLFH